MTISLRALVPEHTDVRDVALPLDESRPRCTLQLRAVPGAGAIHLALMDGAKTALRVEVEAASDETLTISIERNTNGNLSVECAGHRTYLLAPHATEPCPTLAQRSASSLDLLLLVDGTMRAPGTEAKQTVPLLGSDRWRALSEVLSRVVEGLGACYPELRTALIAFGDHPLADVAAASLLSPDYVLHPAEGGKFAARTAAQVKQLLGSVPPTPGGDWVDALADALHASRTLEWRAARRLIILIGDSPGYSVLHPPPAFANAHTRRLDIDAEAFELHRSGAIEIATLYCGAPHDHSRREQNPLREYAREQYAALASRPGMAFAHAEGKATAGFEAETMIKAMLEAPPIFARGPCPGVLLGISQDDLGRI